MRKAFVIAVILATASVANAGLSFLPWFNCCPFPGETFTVEVIQ